MLDSWSIRARLTAWYLCALLIILFAFGIAMHAMIRSHLYSQMDAGLDEEARELAEQLINSQDEFQQTFKLYFSEHGPFSFQIENPDGTIFCSSPWLRAHSLPHFDWDNGNSQCKMQDVSFGKLGSQRLLDRLVRPPSGPLLIRVVVANSWVESNLQSFTRILLVAGSLALFAACLGGAMIARQALRPLERIISDAERISAENFGELVTVKNPNDELGRLASTLNTTFARLRKSMQQMGRFTADAAHELRTPLAVLKLECDVALRGNHDVATLRKSLTLALEEIDRLSGMVEELLILSRMDAGTPLRTFESVFVRALVQDVAESFDVSARKNSVQLVVGEIPDRVVQGDDVALSRLFFNLIDNAIKYTPMGGRVVIQGEEEQGRLTVAISDTGIGIEQQHWDHLFERFYRVDVSRSQSTGGSGLGLAICKSIADAHHAELRIQSDFGRGSTFSVVFSIIPKPILAGYGDERPGELKNANAQ